MKQATIKIKQYCFAINLFILAGALFVTGCQSPSTEDPDSLAMNLEPAAEGADTAVQPAAEASEEAAIDPIPMDNCLDCHSNKDLLIQTANPEEEVISENEGEG